MNNTELIEEILSYDGSSLVLAGPGSGKTSLLIQKLTQLSTPNVLNDRRKVLVLTFNKKASLELKTRLERTGIQHPELIDVYTYHGFGHRLLKAYGSYSGISHPIKLFPPKGRKEFIKALEQEYGTPSFDLFYQKHQAIYGSELREAFVKKHAQEYRKALLDYEMHKNVSNYLDFSELVSRSVDLLQSRQWILNILQDSYPFILIDEFQDTDQVQFEMLALLGRKSQVMAVADEDQIIYAFRGAENGNIKRFGDVFGAKEFYLSYNHRSTNNIVQVANHVIAQNSNRISQQPMITDNSQGEKVKVFLGATLDDEVELIADTVRSWVSQDLGNTAILCREKAKLGKQIVSKVSERLSSYGIHVYQLKPDVLTKDEVIQWFIASLKVLHERSLESLSEFATFLRGIGSSTAERILNITRDANYDIFEIDFQNHISRKQAETLNSVLGVLEPMTSILQTFDYACSVVYAGREEELQRKKSWYADIRRLLVANRHGDWGDFIRNYEYFLDVGNLLKLSKNDVFIGTIHQVKGLEFRNVVVCGVAGNCFPEESNVRENPIEEERRLFYVAITRAMERLYITACIKWFNHVERVPENLPNSIFMRKLPSKHCEVI